MYRILPLLVTLAAPATALAQEAPADDAAPPAADSGREREFDMEMSVRFRRMTLPDSIMDIWYYNADADGWIDGNNDRPSVQGFAPGFEFVVKGDGPNGIFYFDYAVSQVDAGYWDDQEQPPDHDDGDYIVPADNLGVWMLGADYAHELPFVRVENTDGKFGMSILLGGGLGVMGLVGKTQCGNDTGPACRWGPAPGGQSANVRHALGEPPDEAFNRIPPVLPVLDLNASLRFNFGNRVVLRVEGGLHNLVYYGATLGIMF